MLGAVGIFLLILLGLVSYLAWTGFQIYDWYDWSMEFDNLLKPGHQAHALSQITDALPHRIECGGRWLINQPSLAYIEQLDKQGKQLEAARLCDQMASATLGCVPLSMVETDCFERNVNLCYKTCDPIACAESNFTCPRQP
jgi:hypothetical protein